MNTTLVPGFLQSGIIAAACVLSGPSQAVAQPDSNHQWALIGSPGNAPIDYIETPYNHPRSRGSVGYQYYITKTEITGAQWFEFVHAYAPFINPANRFDGRFISERIRPIINPDGTNDYELLPAAANYPVDIGWRYAARYCNWLTNGKVSQAWAFERGAYDTSTFGDLPGGQFTDQIEHTPGAKYWIPTIDEWYKAAYYDPQKNGPGQPGYWLYPTTSDTAPISGLPQDGGQTSGGVPRTGPDFDYPPVAAYVKVTSPWGLWDMSGGKREWSETVSQIPGQYPDARFAKGSQAGNPNWAEADRYSGPPSLRNPHYDYGGLRLVASVPASPTTALGLSIVLCLTLRHRRHP